MAGHGGREHCCDRRRNRVMGALTAVAIVVFSATSGARAEPECPFMECENGEQNPTPARPTPVERPMPAPKLPDRQAPARPATAGETCSNSGGYTYCASSILAPQYGFNYKPSNLVDGRLDTAWVEGKPGNGEGEWVVVDLGGERSVDGIELLNGYHKNQALFAKNNRVRGLEVSFSNGYSANYELGDHGGVQTLGFDAPQRASWVKLTIRSVYRGSKYKDTAISELRINTAR